MGTPRGDRGDDQVSQPLQIDVVLVLRHPDREDGAKSETEGEDAEDQQPFRDQISSRGSFRDVDRGSTPRCR